MKHIQPALLTRSSWRQNVWSQLSRLLGAQRVWPTTLASSLSTALTSAAGCKPWIHQSDGTFAWAWFQHHLKAVKANLPECRTTSDVSLLGLLEVLQVPFFFHQMIFNYNCWLARSETAARAQQLQWARSRNLECVDTTGMSTWSGG